MRLLLAVSLTLFFAGCASPDWTCEAVPSPVELTLKKPDYGNIRLVAISRAGRVTIGEIGGRLAYARTGERFKYRDGSAAGYYRLRSVDSVKGQAVIEDLIFTARAGR